MRKMKVIELLDKIANGEEVPSPIYHNNLYYDFEDGDYFNQKTRNWLFNDSDIETILNDEVEIIEEDKKIEILINCINGVLNGQMSSYYEKTDLQVIVEHNFKVIQEKINEIIDYINKEK